jgi:hypothetical protein
VVTFTVISRERRFGSPAKRNSLDAVAYMQGFSLEQNGKAGDITAGLPPVDYVDYPYIEWYSEENGRVVIEPEREQVEVIGQPVPLDKTVRVSRQEQAANLNEYMQTMLQSIARQRQCSSFGRANVPPPMGITIVADCKAKKE